MILWGGVSEIFVVIIGVLEESLMVVVIWYEGDFVMFFDEMFDDVVIVKIEVWIKDGLVWLKGEENLVLFDVFVRVWVD